MRTSNPLPSRALRGSFQALDFGLLVRVDTRREQRPLLWRREPLGGSLSAELRIFDAKYKAHFAELDEAGWLRMADDVRDSHRADMHQVLAYAALFDATKITTTLVYPLRPSTFAALRSRDRDIARAHLFHGGRQLTLELQGLPFGGA
jgi:hypothetical protein